MRSNAWVNFLGESDDFAPSSPSPGRLPTNFVRSLAHLQLARAARDAGETSDARKAYADFSALMQSAGARYPLLAAAAREAAALPASTPATTR